MKIVGSDRHKFIIKERTTKVLENAFMFFVAGLMLTINSARDTRSFFFLLGPVVMALSFIFAVYFYKIVTIVIDRYGHKIIRNVRKATKSYAEKISIDDTEEIVLVKKENTGFSFLKKELFDIYITFTDGSAVQLNIYPIKKKLATNIGYEIASFLSIPMSTK